MFGFKKKDKKHKTASKTGVKHGVCFAQNDTKWTLDPSIVKNFLVVGDKADEAGIKILTALRQNGWKTILLTDKENGLVANSPNDVKTTDLDTAIRTLEDLQSQTALRFITAGHESTALDDSTLLVVNGQFDEPGGDSAVVDDEIDDSYENDLKDSAGKLVDVVGAGTAGKIEEIITADKSLDDEGAAVGRWAVMLLDDLYSNGGKNIIPSSGKMKTLAGQLASWTEEIELAQLLGIARQDLVYAEALKVLLQCDSRIGLPWVPIASDKKELDAALLSVAASIGDLKASEADSKITAHEKLWGIIAILARMTSTTGVHVLVIEDKPSITDLNETLRGVQARVIAGDLRPEDSWAMGVVKDEHVDYGSGDLAVVSTVDRGLRGRGTEISPSFMLDRTQISMI